MKRVRQLCSNRSLATLFQFTSLRSPRLADLAGCRSDAELDFWPEGANGDWRVGEESTSVIDAYRASIERADAIIAERPLSAPRERPEE